MASTTTTTKTVRFLHLQRLLLHLIGYDTRDDDDDGNARPHKSRRRRSRLLSAVTTLNIVLLYGIMVPELAYVIVHRDDIQRVTDGLCPLLFGAASSARLLTLHLRQRRFRRLIGRLDALWRREATRSAAAARLLERASALESRLSWPYVLSTSAVGVLYLVAPLASAWWQMGHNDGGGGEVVVWDVPMRSYFVYDLKRSPNYELTYLWFALCTFLCAFGCTGIDTLFYAAAFNLSAHFQILQQRARAVRYGTASDVGGGHRRRRRRFVDVDSSTDADTQARRDLDAVIAYHRRVQRLADGLTRTYQPILFTHFAIASVQVCVIAYQLTLPGAGVPALLQYTVFLLAIAFQCFVYCHGGTRLETESARLADALYAGEWWRAAGDWRLQRCVGLCVLRAQRPVAVRTWFFAANLFTFSSIFRTAGSYIALLQTMSGKE